MDIKFIDYTGQFPNLCHGVLTLEINGSRYKFGHEPGAFDFHTMKYKDNNFIQFWYSGGCVNFDDVDNPYIETGSWKIDKDCLPEILKPYAEELTKILNENMKHGCCGGCI